MRTHRRRLLLVGLVGGVALSFAMQVNFISPASGTIAFDNGDLDGAYAGGLMGTTIISGTQSLPAVGVIKLVADGAGNLTLEIRRNSGGIFVAATQSCTYVIESSGFGTVQCPVGFISLLLSDGGKQLDLILQGAFVIGGHLSRQ
jgi:hypothetical protein